jgi:hypothetical protein
MPYKNKEDYKLNQVRTREHRLELARLRYVKNKEKIQERNKEWRENNPEKVKKMVRSYYDSHKQQAIDAAKRWKKRNPDKVKAGNHIYKETNREIILLKGAEYRKNNPEKVKISWKNYHSKNREKINLKGREYRKKYPEKGAAYQRYRMKTDLLYKLESALRHRLFIQLKRKNIEGPFNCGAAIKFLGCTVEEFKEHIEKQFTSGMSWDNWAYKGWQIDHILPLDIFDLTKEEELKEVCHYTNMQPLWWYENIKKGNKLNYGK